MGTGEGAARDHGASGPAAGCVDLSIVVPVLNEEAILQRMLSAAVDAGTDLIRQRLIQDFEIVVVDDGSTDRSTAVVLEAARHHPIVRLVDHERNRGLGAALRTGFASSRGRLVLLTDADLPFNLAETAKAIRLLRYYDADIVSAYRFDRTGEGPRRFVYSYVYNALCRLVLGLRVRDVNFAAKLVRRDVLDSITLHSEGSFIDAELLARAQRSGRYIVQFGVDYFPRRSGESSLSSLSVIGQILREMATQLPSIRATAPQGHRDRG